MKSTKTFDESVSCTNAENPAEKQGEKNCKDLETESYVSECRTFEDESVYIDEVTHKLCTLNALGIAIVVSDELRIKKVVKNLDSNAVKITLKHVTKWVQHDFDVKLEELRKDKLLGVLLKKGVMVCEDCVRDLSSYLFGQCQSYIDTYGYSFEHIRLGWGKKGRTSGFFASKSIQAPYHSSVWKNETKFLGSSGNQADYDTMVQNEIIPNKSMHLPFVLGFTAPVVPLVSKKSDVPVLLINFAGKSSMGKSTSMKLIASIWGKGRISNSRLSVCKTFSCTENGFEASVNGNKGIPALFDDFQAATKQTYFSDLIYRLTQGESKIRCNKKGQVLDTLDWSTTIAFTGEHNIFDYLSNDSGLKGRIVQFQNVEWTASEANVTNINSVIGDNCGFYGEKFVDLLLGKTEDELYKYFFDSKTVLETKLTAKDGVSTRIQNRLAIIRMTAVLVNELINPGIDVDFITDFLIENEKKRESELDVFEDAKERLIEFINKNIPNFVRLALEKQFVAIPHNRIVGRIYNGKQGRLVAILPDEFKKLKQQFGDADLVLEKWRASGFLVTEGANRFTKKVKISTFAVAPRCYVFMFEDFNQLFNKFAKDEEIDVQDLEEEDFISAATTHTYVKVSSEESQKVPHQRLAITKPVEITPRGSETHDEYKHEPVPVPSNIKSEPPVIDGNYDDKEAIDAIFEDSDDDEDESDEED